MTIAYDQQEQEWSAQSEQNPFAESLPEARAEPESGATTWHALASWNESLNPFSETSGEAILESEADRLVAEAFAELRDEGFDEAVAFLAEETEQAVDDRFTNEIAGVGRGARTLCRRSPCSRCASRPSNICEALEAGLAGLEVGSLIEQQLDEVLDRFDPQTGELTPAGEEFIGALIKKAKGAVKFVANAAKSVGKVAGRCSGRC